MATPLSGRLLPSDIDNDGDLDVVELGAETVWYYENLGSAVGFRRHELEFIGQTSAFDIAIGDMNSDGFVDLVYVSLDGSLFVGLNRPTAPGEFAPPQRIDTDLWGGRPQLADLDNDDDLDLLLAGRIPVPDENSPQNELGLWWLENLGNGVFREADSVDQMRPLVQGFVTGDIDNDGRIDIVSIDRDLLGEGAPASLILHRNLGGGVFAIPEVMVDGFLSSQLLNIEKMPLTAINVNLGDIDDDGDLDVVLGGRNHITWFENVDGMGTYGKGHIVDATDADGGLWVSLADLNGDDRIDLIGRFRQGIDWYEDLGLYWYENLGNGDFSLARQVATAVAGVAVADFDGDQNLEMFAGVFSQGRWTVVIIQPEVVPLVADVNIDGFVDFADFLILSANFGRDDAVEKSDGDLDGDGRVGFADFLLLAANFS